MFHADLGIIRNHVAALVLFFPLLLPACAETESEGPQSVVEQEALSQQLNSIALPIINPPRFDDQLIVPGQRAGNIFLGMSTAELLHVAGYPKDVIREVGVTAQYHYSNFRVRVRDSDQRVVGIRVYGKFDSIGRSVRLGSASSRLVAALGDPDDTWSWVDGDTNYFWRSGLAVALVDKGVAWFDVCLPQISHQLCTYEPGGH